MNAQDRQTRGRGRRRYGLTAAIALGLLAVGLAQQPRPAAADTWGPQAPPVCPTATYTVPADTRFVAVEAIGGAGRGGYTFNDNNTGGGGGAGAKVTAHLPVTPGQQLNVVVAHNGDPDDPRAGFPNGGTTAFASGKGGGSSVVTTSAGDPCLGASAQRGAILVLAGGGGGGGGASPFGSGGAGGNAGVNLDDSGQPGMRAYYPSGYDGGSGGLGGTAAAAGAGGGGGCSLYCARPGLAGTGFTGGSGRGSFYDDDGPDGAGGAGGGGYYGGGGGGGGNNLGGGGGGAGSSYIMPTNYSTSISKDTTGKPAVTITPLATSATTVTLSGTTSGNDWYTSPVTVTLTTRAGTFGLGKTYFTFNDPGCSAANVHALDRCTEYKGPFTLSRGVHTLTYFSVDAVGLDEAVQTKSFAVTVTTAAVSGANIGSGANPTATSGGSVTVTSTGTGVVGAAVYGANPTGQPTTFNSSGAYVDVIAAGSGLTTLTILNCHLNGGTDVYWWNCTVWARAQTQTYNAMTKCVTITLNGASSPTISQLTGTVFAAGSPPSITAVATTPGNTPYISGTWTNQTVTVAFTCSAGATASAPVPRGTDGQNQTADGTCTDGVQPPQTTRTTFSGINVDKTPPTCVVSVSPTVLRPPNLKLVAITGKVMAADTLSGVAKVVGGPVTGSEAIAVADVQGFVIDTRIPTALQLSAEVTIAGQLMATHNPSGSPSGRAYSQTVTVTDQAGNTNAMPCTWTVSVPRDQAPAR